MNGNFELSSEEDEIFLKYKTKRMAELKQTNSTVGELDTERLLIKKTKSNRMIVHFYKPEFKRCRIMNERLNRVCKFFPDIEFYKIDPDKCPMVVEKIGVKILPFLGFFKDGYYVGHQVGFENLGDEDFEADDLVKIIKESNMFE